MKATSPVAVHTRLGCSEKCVPDSVDQESRTVEVSKAVEQGIAFPREPRNSFLEKACREDARVALILCASQQRCKKADSAGDSVIPATHRGCINIITRCLPRVEQLDSMNVKQVMLSSVLMVEKMPNSRGGGTENASQQHCGSATEEH